MTVEDRRQMIIVEDRGQMMIVEDRRQIIIVEDRGQVMIVEDGTNREGKEFHPVTMVTALCRVFEAGAAARSGAGLELEGCQAEEDGGHS